MFAKSIITSSLLLAAGAMATQSPSDSSVSSMTGTDGSMVSVQVVQVSNMNATLKFYPEEIRAEPGSMVQFQFYPRNHTVTQSTFANPCEPINRIMPNVTGINSGPMPPENGMMKVFTIMVNDTKPLWMYCATGNHCQSGMVMAINAPSEGDKTLALYKEAAARTSPAGLNSTSNSTNSTSGNNAPDSAAAEGSASSLVNSMVGATSLASFMVAAFVLFL